MSRSSSDARDHHGRVRGRAPVLEPTCSSSTPANRAAYAAWHVDPGGRPRSSTCPRRSWSPIPERALAGIPADARVRVICNAGNASRRAADALGPSAEVRSVEGGLIGWSRVLQADEVPLAGPFTVVQLRREARGCLSYVVIAGGEALVVDPAPDVQPYIEEADRRGARITHVLDTHVHADHLSGAPRAGPADRGRAPPVPCRARARAAATRDEVAPVADGDTIALGDERPHRRRAAGPHDRHDRRCSSATRP